MIDLTIADGIAEVVLNAPEKMNALNEEAIAELGAAYDDAAAAASRGEVRALLLRGEGRGFCAGRDISAVTPADDDVMGYLGDKVTPLLQSMSAFPAPTFAAVQGACLGVGLGLAIATDVVYVAENAKIGSPFANLGATLDSGGHWLFTERLGTHRTLDLIYTAELISGAEAVSSGLFSRAMPAESLLEDTRAIVAKVAGGATGAFVASKGLVAQIRDERLGLWDSMATENRAQADLCGTEDYAEGFAAFQQKRKPEFRGVSGTSLPR
ncbi:MULTISPECIES: enoyl-CoA hydratase/isomerase family protein [Micrococcaceae]|uniref:enoyl-CoA hydratase/isomerase family protein n=1 Tax=Micrococcaceae TaxID=1268 RepID=UPI00161CA12F|nr:MULTISPECIES: enoyl-CoA hydratase/isomerase family protein [Micrococcaceae]MBB5750636.1 enoyl-CoA hydratase/carnithine racemase [Micrococcus sp. TA1]HRO30867.1 enoyl-CoA hydratase/isomerase family protein [Citricoccus sp.]HRO92973.1 enoyl-CoA hydratase/isomerase family protein [Citricoccus sp.]